MKQILPIIAALTLLNTTLAQASTPLSCRLVLNSAPTKSSEIHDLMLKAINPGPGQAEARKLAQQALGLDDRNFIYYMALFQQNKGGGPSKSVKLYPATDHHLIAYPVGTAAMPEGAQFKSVNYETVQKEYTGQYAKRAVLDLSKLHAGTGSSVSREEFLNRPDVRASLNLPASGEIKLGAKGTDLVATIPHPLNKNQKVEVSIVEVQLLQAYVSAKKGEYSGIILRDIVGPETQNRLREIWNKKSLIDPNLSYADLFAKIPGLSRGQATYQSHVPALDKDSGKVSLNRVSPAGHGLFAVDAIMSAVTPGKLPNTGNRPLVAAIANGEDLNSLPDAAIVDWTLRNKAPIVLVTTTKSSIDAKGGLLTLVKDSKTGESYLKVVDTAEAEAAGQLKEFEASEGIVSTNLTLFNYSALSAKLARLTQEELLEAATPDVLLNNKKQKDKDGVTRAYTQLEGTMGTSIMNLDRYYRKKFGEPLVYIVNIENSRRTDFFSPIKSAFDYYLQFHSDRFEVNPANYRLKHNNRDLPKFALLDPATENKYYGNVSNVLSSFKNTSVKDLKQLSIEGQVNLSNVVLRGEVTVVNKSGKMFDVNQIANRFVKKSGKKAVLENVVIQINQQGEAEIQWKGFGHARVGVAGSHTDYNNGWTLSSLLPVLTTTYVKPREDNRINLSSAGSEKTFILGKETRSDDWDDYIKGITTVLAKAGHKIPGADITIQSNIPLGSGLSSSAALTTSVLKSFRNAYGLKISDIEIAKMGQQVEKYVGANTGLLDQMTISYLDQDVKSMLYVDFKELSENQRYEPKKVQMPDDVEFVIIHSGMRHSLKDNHGDRNYATRRAECESAAAKLGVKTLREITIDQLESQKDKLTEAEYKRAYHVVTENARVQRFLRAMSSRNSDEMGAIMDESHMSQRDFYDISEGPIEVLVKAAQARKDVLGAQLTGGGFGGAVVLLTKKGQGRKAAEEVARAYENHPLIKSHNAKVKEEKDKLKPQVIAF